jgi:hypothetical protein
VAGWELHGITCCDPSNQTLVTNYPICNPHTEILTILLVSYHAWYVFVMWFSLPAFIVVWYPIYNHHRENLTFLFVSYGLIMCLSHVIFTCSFIHHLMPNLQCGMVNTLKQALFDTILSLSFCTLFASCMILGKIEHLYSNQVHILIFLGIFIVTFSSWVCRDFKTSPLFFW